MTIKSRLPTPEYLSNWDRVFVKGYGFKKKIKVSEVQQMVDYMREKSIKPDNNGMITLEVKNERVNNKKRNKRLARK